MDAVRVFASRHVAPWLNWFDLETNRASLSNQEKNACLKNKQSCLEAMQAGSGAGLLAIPDHQ
jgi:hypothetical protein